MGLIILVGGWEKEKKKKVKAGNMQKERREQVAWRIV